ncbi:MAG: glycosyltransferase [Actinomycetota bacterium]|nr:glycosyltransferase [Actinomycetota bacterium]
MSVDVSVVICAYDDRRWGQLEAAVRSVAEQRYRAAETIIVVDHNSSLLARARARFAAATVVENSRQPGLCGTRNSGIEAASGSVVAFLDDDAIASPGWLEMLVEQYADRTVAGVGGGIEPVWEAGRPRWFPAEFDWVVGCSYRGMPQVAQEVRNLFGCNMSFRRELLNTIGGFRLGYSCDETELCIRMHQQWPSRKLVYVPAGNALHHVTSERARLRYFLARCYFEGGSKAVVSRLVGAGPGLSSERTYIRETLREAVWRCAWDFLKRGDLDALARATTIVAGLATTSLGYMAGGLFTTRAARHRGWSGEALTRSPIAWRWRTAQVIR